MAETGGVGYVRPMSICQKLQLDEVIATARPILERSFAHPPYEIRAREDVGAGGDPIVWLEAWFRTRDEAPATDRKQDAAVALHNALRSAGEERNVHLLVKRDTDGPALPKY